MKKDPPFVAVKLTLIALILKDKKLSYRDIIAIPFKISIQFEISVLVSLSRKVEYHNFNLYF